MTTSVQSLAGWLLERIAEDEAAVSGAAYVHMSGSLELASGRDLRLHWDRRRVLAECESKRRIVELHRPSAEGYEDDGPQEACLLCQWDVDCDMVRYDHQYPDHARNHARWWPCDTLRLLALPYADRPGYDEEWRP